jgi:LysM repeat protein
MAKKNTPKKFRQARAAAKADAKKVFSGKKQAFRRDPNLKYSADDVKALKEVSKEARAGFITDDRGQRVNVKPTETARERIARENAEAMRKFREQAEAEDGPKKAAKKAEAPKKAAPVAASTKPSAKKNATRAEKSAANKAKWAKMTPAERKAWSATKGKAADKPAAKLGVKKPSVVYSITDAKPGASDKSKPAKNIKKAKLSDKTIKAVTTTTKPTPKAGTAVAVRPKGTVASTGAKAAAKNSRTTKVLKGIARGAGKVVGGRVGAIATVGALAASAIPRGQRPTTGDMMAARAKAAQEGQGVKMDKASYGRAVPGGAKATAVSAGGATSKVVNQRSNQPRLTGKGRFVGPASAATFAGSGKAEAKPGGKSSGSASGSIASGKGYRVETGDTLSAIAKRAGVSLAELMAANPNIKDPRKIYRNTLVKIPKTGTTPAPGYTGPVPFVPGSKAAKKYEASRKK